MSEPEEPSAAEYVNMTDGVEMDESERYHDGHYPQLDRRAVFGSLRTNKSYLLEYEHYMDLFWERAGEVEYG